MQQPIEAPAIETEADGRSWLQLGIVAGIILGIVLAFVIAGRLAQQSDKSQTGDEAQATDLDAPV